MNPEADVIADIDALIDETMAAGVDHLGRPLDDYSADRYPQCPTCWHEWHGLRCTVCRCEASDGEAAPVDDHYDDVFFGSLPEAPWLILHQPNPDQDGAAIQQDPRDYLADIEAMRWHSQRHVLGEDPLRRAQRFIASLQECYDGLINGGGAHGDDT